jgi:ATP-dependent Lhr-like helicase
MAALFAYRLSQQQPLTFSLAMNDYGFELLSDQYFQLEPGTWNPSERLGAGPEHGKLEELFNTQNAAADIMNSANASQLSRRKFRDIARIAGLVFQGFPGKQKKARHLQASSSLFYDVFTNYDSGNLLLRQAHDETLAFQLDEARIRTALHRIAEQKIVIKHIDAPTPFAAPLLVDRLREKMGSEKTGERIRKLIAGGKK